MFCVVGPLWGQTPADSEDASVHVLALGPLGGYLGALTVGNVELAFGADIDADGGNTFVWTIGYTSLTPDQREPSVYWKIRAGVVGIDRVDIVDIITTSDDPSNEPLLGVAALVGYKFTFGNERKFFIPLGIGLALHETSRDDTNVTGAVDLAIGYAF